MIFVKAYAASAPDEILRPFSISRREPGDHDVLIDILYCGVCHSDIHQVRNEWRDSIYPMVPGHEIVGRVLKIGTLVKKFKVGDMAAVGCFVDSCRTCDSCMEGEEQYCEVHTASTYNGTEMDLISPTYGGYSNKIVVDEKYSLKIPGNLSLERVAPLLCAGITTYSPLRQWKLEKGQRLGVIGLGGLGHMALKLGVSMGAEVTLLSSSPSKEQDARRLGAHHFVYTSDSRAMSMQRNYFHLIIDTVSAPHDFNDYLPLLKKGGTMILVGIPPKPFQIDAFKLLSNRRRLVGSINGGIAETQEMLDYCGEYDIMSDVEVIRIQQINEAYERMLKADVRYRFVIDMSSL